MSNKNNYLELSADCKPILFQSFDGTKLVTSECFDAKKLTDIDYQFTFKYNVPSSKVKLSLLQVQDIVKFYKIYSKENPDWADKTEVFVKTEEI